MKVDMAALNSLRKVLREQRDVLGRNEKLPCLDPQDDGEGCIRRQGNVIEKNGNKRTFDRFDVNAMCASCTAYWHVDRAISALRDLKAIAENFGAQQ